MQGTVQKYGIQCQYSSRLWRCNSLERMACRVEVTQDGSGPHLSPLHFLTLHHLSGVSLASAESLSHECLSNPKHLT